MPTTPGGLLKLARTGAFGPTYMSREWQDDELPPHLVSVVVTRVLPKGLYLPHLMLVDRTCLGVKNAFTAEPMSPTELATFIERVGIAHRDGIESVELHVAQSVVFHAIDYASSLGFRPHREFDSSMLGSRPSVLEPTPLARLSRPFYLSGPDDDVARVVAMLRAAVGDDGYDVVSPDDEDDDDFQEDDVGTTGLLPDEASLAAAIQTWFGSLNKDDRLDVTAAYEAYLHAVLGEAPGLGKQLDAEHATSLPPTWASFFRPLADGRTGLDLAREARTMAPFREELDRLARTRATLFDVLGVDRHRGVAICRNVFDGTALDVRLTSAMLSKITRWTRFFGYITPMADGTWHHPSTLYGHPWLRNLEPGKTIALVNELLAELGIAERVDPENPSRGLTRFAALVHGVLHRSIAPNEEQAAEANSVLYCVNSDGERFEPHEALLSPGATHAAALVAALSSADDFVKEAGFGWKGEPREVEVEVVAHERIASVEPDEDGALRISANSAERFRRLLARLSSLAGVPLEPLNLEVMRPWEHIPRAVSEETPNARRMIIGAAITHQDPALAIATTALEGVRRALDDEVPALGGRPRALVRDAEGRIRVERWLADAELRGTPGDAGDSFLDLDEVRRELGLPPILERRL